MLYGETRVMRNGVAHRRGRPGIARGTFRDLLVLGTYDPAAGDFTGVKAGVDLVDVNTPVTFTTPNQRIAGLRFNSTVYIAATATGLVFEDCAFPGITYTPTADVSIISGQSGDLRGATLIDCDLVIPPDRRSPWTYNITGGNFTLRRCKVAGGVDGVGLTMPDTVPPVTIEQSWIHDGHWESWSAGAADKPTNWDDNKTHDDAIQIHRGKGHRIRGNHIGGRRQPLAVVDRTLSDDFNNAGIMCQQEVSSSSTDWLDDVLIELNYVEGGAASINLGYKFGNDLAGVTVRDNIFPVQDWSPPTYYILRNPGTNPVLSGNVRRYTNGTTDAVPVGP